MILKPPKPLSEKEQLLEGLTDEHQDILLKMIEIQDALFNDEYELNYLNPKHNYMLVYFNICLLLDDEKKDFSDKCIARQVTNLYNKMFKNRRY